MLHRVLIDAFDTLALEDWRGLASEIARTGEEDPLAIVDDPDLREVVAAKMELRRSYEARMFEELGERGLRLGAIFREAETMRSNDDLPRQKLAEAAPDIQSVMVNLADGTAKRRDRKIASLYFLSQFCDLAEPIFADGEI